MTSQIPSLLVRRHDEEGMHQLRDDLLAVYAEVYADLVDDPFFTPHRFWERLEKNYAPWPGFSLVTGWLNGSLVGYSLGYRLPKGSLWWQGYRGDAAPDALIEDGKRTFALTQLMVLPARQRHGYARRLHDALLNDRPEQRATLLVKPGNVPARTAYLKWGWRRFGQVKPFDDSPVYDSLTTQLPLDA